MAVFVAADAIDFVGESGARSLAKRYLQQLDADEAALDSLVASVPIDHAEVRRHAHSLKTAAAYLGGRRLRQAAIDLEDAALAQSGPRVCAHAAAVRRERRALASALESWS